MSLGGQSIYPGVLSWLGMARELTAGTPLVPVVTQPLDQSDYSPEDMPKFLDDKAIRGSMTDLFYKTLGVESAQFSFGAPNFLDTQGYWFDNVFGDLSTVGSCLANPATVSGTIRGRRHQLHPRRRAPRPVHGRRDHPDRRVTDRRGRRHRLDRSAATW